jgi:dTDP-L-rhamnose 4-epimerase
MKVLITGGAGFIGQHLARRLLREKCEVVLADSLSEQIHGSGFDLPQDLRGCPLLVRDVSAPAAWEGLLDGVEAVVHLAAETGTGQSMYEVARYDRINHGGTALLMHHIVNGLAPSVGKVVVASSRATYGEGKYVCPEHGTVFPGARTAERMKAGHFEPQCTLCGRDCVSVPTTEDAPFRPTSFYGLTKQVQEQMVLMMAKAAGISAYALRYQNVFGPGQSLKNPYTGILAIFSNLARANQPIQIFEDGLESRDFVYVSDVVDATARCVLRAEPEVLAMNIGSGQATSVLDVAREIVAYFGSASETRVTGAFRLGDIRHNRADLSVARATLGFEPKVFFKEGIREFLKWVSGQEGAGAAGYERSLLEMRAKGLYHGD